MRLALLLSLIAFAPLAALGEPPLPRPRPAAEASPTGAQAPAAPVPVAPAPVAPALPSAPPVEPRSSQLGCPSVLSGEVTATVLPPLHEGECGIATPLAVTALGVNGHAVAFSTPATLDCALVSALPGWIGDIDAFARATLKSPLQSIDIATGYACRNVDNAATGKLSVHAFGGALDVTRLVLADGQSFSIAADYRASGGGGALLRFAHQSACARFTTVLGPDADSFHQDNLHVDVGCHGRACTARLCQ